MEQQKLKKILIEGLWFEFDLDKLALVDLRYGTTYSFLHMDFGYLGYGLTYFNGEEIRRLNVPPMSQIDPEGVARKFNVNVGEALNDFDVIADKKAIEERYKLGRQPTIEIAGDHFFVNWHLEQLVRKDDFTGSGLRFSEMKRDSGSVHFIFDTATKKITSLDLDAFQSFGDIPGNIICVRIPDPICLDVVGYCRSKGIPVEYGLELAMFRRHHIAEICPWQNTSIGKSFQEFQGRKPEKNRISKGRKKGQGR